MTEEYPLADATLSTTDGPLESAPQPAPSAGLREAARKEAARWVENAATFPDDGSALWTFMAWGKRIIRAALDGEAEPIPMVLHCPVCGLQHVDAPEPSVMFDNGMGVRQRGWDNPPHRSHLCHGCGHVWRPADVATVGVAQIATRGKDDAAAPPPPSGPTREEVALVKAGWTPPKGHPLAEPFCVLATSHPAGEASPTDERLERRRKAGHQ